MSESIRAVERALAILLCFSQNTPELTLTQIADRVSLNKSTVHRLLGTLDRNRFIQRDPATGAYRPGIRLMQFAYLMVEQNDLRRYAAPFLHLLREQFRETVDLAILDNAEVVYLDVLESPQRVKLAAAIGQRLPAFCTATGKVLLAYMDDGTIQRIMDNGMPKHTDCTIISREAFLENLRAIRAKGFAISEQEYEEEINAVAAPILDQHGLPIAAVAIAGPAYRLTRERMSEIGPSVVAATRDISQEIELTAYPQPPVND
jgi:IclR family transcriptional regulator, KDG regulon repressor